MENIETELKPSRIEKIGDEQILIFDDLFVRKDIIHFHELMSLSEFTFLHSSRFDTKKYKEWMADFAINDFELHPLHKIAKNIAEYFSKGDRNLKCYSAFCNASSFGNQSFIHSDSYGKPNISVLYYVNSKWNIDWGGETIFFDNNQEARVAIGYKPGRIIVFNSELVHRAGVPSRICPDIRLTLSIRFEDVF